MGPLLMAAATIGGTMVLTGAVTAIANANNGMEKDRSSSITPSAVQQPTDTRGPKQGVEMIQHEILSRPGMRVRVIGTVDSDDALANVRKFGGSANDVFDNREQIDDGKIDDLLSSKMR